MQIESISIGVLVNKRLFDFKSVKTTKETEALTRNLFSIQWDIQNQLKTLLKTYPVNTHQAVDFVDFNQNSLLSAVSVPNHHVYWLLPLALSIIALTLIPILAIRKLQPQIQEKPKNHFWDILNKGDGNSLANVFNGEKPETIALLMSSLEPERSAELLSMLDIQKQAQIVKFMSELDALEPDALRQLLGTR